MFDQRIVDNTHLKFQKLEVQDHIEVMVLKEVVLESFSPWLMIHFVIHDCAGESNCLKECE